MTDRLRSSKNFGLTLSCLGALGALLLVGCSGLDPASGRFRLDPPDDLGDADTVGDAAPQEEGGVDPGGVSFARDIRPLINRPGRGDPSGRGCKGCHYNTEANHTGLDLGSFDMTTLRLLRQGGGSSGLRIIVPGKPNESVLVQVLVGSYPYAARMPKGSGMYWTLEEIQLVKDWIAQGAKGADGE